MELDEDNDKDDRKRPSLPTPVLNIYSPKTPSTFTCAISQLGVASKNECQTSKYWSCLKKSRFQD